MVVCRSKFDSEPTEKFALNFSWIPGKRLNAGELSPDLKSFRNEVFKRFKGLGALSDDTEEISLEVFRDSSSKVSSALEAWSLVRLR